MHWRQVCCKPDKTEILKICTYYTATRLIHTHQRGRCTAIVGWRRNDQRDDQLETNQDLCKPELVRGTVPEFDTCRPVWPSWPLDKCRTLKMPCLSNLTWGKVLVKKNLWAAFMLIAHVKQTVTSGSPVTVCHSEAYTWNCYEFNSVDWPFRKKAFLRVSETQTAYLPHSSCSSKQVFYHVF